MKLCISSSLCGKVQFVKWEDPSVTMELTLPAMMMITQWTLLTLLLSVRRIATSPTRRCSQLTFTPAWFYPAYTWKIFLYLKCSSWTHEAVDKMFIFVFSIWSVHCSFVGGKMWYFVSCSAAGKYVVTLVISWSWLMCMTLKHGHMIHTHGSVTLQHGTCITGVNIWLMYAVDWYIINSCYLSLA